MKWALAAVCAVLLAPLALVEVPPLLDYPNHLARAVVLAFGDGDPNLSRMYAAHWTVIPNLGLDLVLPPLMQVLPIHVAGRIVVGIAILLPVMGTVAYSRATFRTASAWPLASGLVAYNATLLLGFINFIAAIGIALLLAAAWITWRERHPLHVAALAGVGAAALFFCHLMGLVFLFALVAGYELERLWPDRAHPTAILRRFAALIPMAVVPLVLYLVSRLASLPAETEFTPVLDKLRQLIFPFANYILPLDIATACVVAAFLLACLATGRCRTTPGAGIALSLVAALYVLAPWSFKGTYFFDIRFLIMFGFLVFGAVLPSGLPRMAGHATVAGFSLLFGIRMAVVCLAWVGHRQDVADMRAVTATVEPQARVFVAAVAPEEAPEYWQNARMSRMLSTDIRLDYHLAALLVIERHAFWPFLFDNPAQQPVRTLPPYHELAERAGSIADVSGVAQPGKADLCGFDYLLLLEAGGEPDMAHFAADRLILLARTDFVALFRIRSTACAARTFPESRR